MILKRILNKAPSDEVVIFEKRAYSIIFCDWLIILNSLCLKRKEVGINLVSIMQQKGVVLILYQILNIVFFIFYGQIIQYPLNYLRPICYDELTVRKIN